MLDPCHLLYLDAYHLEDATFLPTLARLMHRRTTLPPVMMVHGSGGRAERLLEAEGLFPERSHGIIRPTTAKEAALVDRGVREANRKIVGTLTDEIVSSVGVQGVDRGLLCLEDGVVRVGRARWMHDLLAQHVVLVVSALAPSEEEGGYPVEVPAGEAALAFAQVFEATDRPPRLVLFTANDAAGVDEEGEVQAEIALADVPASLVPDPDVLRRAVTAGHEVYLTSPVGLFGGDEPRWTHIIARKSL